MKWIIYHIHIKEMWGHIVRQMHDPRHGYLKGPGEHGDHQPFQQGQGVVKLQFFKDNSNLWLQN